MTHDDPNHPYSTTVMAGDLVFISGCLSVDENGAIVDGRRSALDAALAMVQRRLNGLNLDVDDLVKLTYFVTDVSLRDEANQQFCDTWQVPRPARTLVQVAQLPYGASVEIDAVASRGGSA